MHSRDTHPHNSTAHSPPECTPYQWISIVLTTAGLVVLMFYTYYAREQAQIIALQTETSNRAWMLYSHDAPFDLRRAASCTIYLSNSGRSPAIGTSMFVVAVTDRDAPTPHLPANWHAEVSRWAGFQHPATFVTGPGETLVTEVPIPALGPAELAAIRSGEGILYLYGEILYQDGFGHDRHTRITLCLDSLGWRIAPNGNSAD